MHRLNKKSEIFRSFVETVGMFDADFHVYVLLLEKDKSKNNYFTKFLSVNYVLNWFLYNVQNTIDIYVCSCGWIFISIDDYYNDKNIW